MGGIAGFLVGFLVLGIVFSLVERRWPARMPTPLLQKRRLVDVAYWVLGQTAGKWIAEAASFLAILGTALFLRIPLDGFDTWMAERSLFGKLPWLLQVPVALLTADFLGYWQHRLMHGTRLFRLHAIHHSPRSLDWLSAARNHPLAEAFGRVWMIVPLLYLGIDPRVLAPLVPAIGLWGLLLHANVSFRFHALRYVVATPHFHRWHHAAEREALGKNFAALFPVWDLVFGTFYLPDRRPMFFGVVADDPEDEMPDTFLGQMLHPLRRRKGRDGRREEPAPPALTR
jgi:sterol desaturase/sphingolipid hydroxylase (fatty acid hydroxylase superfamily)